MKRHLLTCLLLVLCTTVSSMETQRDSLADIYGILKMTYTTSTVSSIYHPNVMLVTYDGEKSDTTYTQPNRFSVNNTFTFKKIRPHKEVYLKIFCVGMKTIEGRYQLEPGRNVFYFTMEPEPEKLKESKVTAKMELMKQIKDTTVYNAAAISTMEGDNLREMLEQLPGFKVTDSGINVDGEKIKRAYVNGVLVFGDNPMAAVNNLKADEVKQVKVYEEQSAVDKRRGQKMSRKEKVLDIVTKEPILSLAYLGLRAQVGADDTKQPRYLGLGTVSYHSEMLEINADAKIDNLSQNYGGLGLILGSSALSISPGLSTDTQLKEYNEHQHANLFAKKYWKDRNYGNSADVYYSYRRNYTKDASTVLREYFAQENIPAMSGSDTTSSSRVDGRHYLSLNFHLMDTPLKTLLLTLNGSITDNYSHELNASKTIHEGSETSYSRHEISNSDNRSYEASAHLIWENNDATKLRPTAMLMFDFTDNKNMAWTVDTLATSFDKRQLTADGFGRTMKAGVRFNLAGMVINNENHHLAINTGLNSYYNRNRSRTLTVDEFMADSPNIDIANSYDKTWNGLESTLFASLDYTNRNMQLSAGLNLQNAIQIDDEKFPVPPYSQDPASWKGEGSNRTYWSVLPMMALKYKEILLLINTSSSIPSMEQTRERISDTNPLVLTGGNPDLKPSYSFEPRLSWNKRMAQGLCSIIAELNGSLLYNPIVSKTEYFSENTVLEKWNGYEALAGSMLNTFENSKRPSWNASANLSSANMILNRKLTIEAGLNTSLASFPQYYGQNLIGVNNLNAGGKVHIKVRPSRAVNIVISGNATYMNSQNDGKELLSERMQYRGTASTHCTLFKKMRIDARYIFSAYDYLGGAGRNFMSHQLDTSIGWNFLKNTLNVAMQGLDLLNSGSIYTSSVTAESITQTWKPVYGRYFLLRVTYNFRKKG